MVAKYDPERIKKWPRNDPEMTQTESRYDGMVEEIWLKKWRQNDPKFDPKMTQMEPR